MKRESIQLVWRKIDELIPYEGNAKLHPQEQVDRLVDSFNEFGRIVPAGVDAQGNLIYGHGRILAARQRGDTEFPCIEIDGLSELQRRAFVHADNLLAQSPTDESVLRGEMRALAAAGFDVTITGFDPAGLQLGSDSSEGLPFWGEVEQESTEEYEAFVEKFKQKLTTDDVYTPDNVYRAVRDWAFAHYDLEGAPVVRPFYPGGDYKSADYPGGCVVIDNPPFSILSEICGWYEAHGIRYLLFAPGLTLFSINAGQSRYLPCGISIEYTNGASIATSFVTSMGDWRIEICPELYRAVDEANTENLRKTRKLFPVYTYPAAVASVSMNKLAKWGQAMQIGDDAAMFIRALDSQREADKAIYGGGFLLCSNAAAEKAAAEKAAAEKAAAEKAAAEKAAAGDPDRCWTLSQRELDLIAEMDRKAAST